MDRIVNRVAIPADLPPFRLVGDRNYVQGSQMLSHAHALAGPAAILTQCAFRRITPHVPTVLALKSEEAVPAMAIGDATFSSPGPTRRYAFLDSETPALREPEQTSWSLTLQQHPAPLAACFCFAGAAHFGAVLELVIRALKTVHAGLAADVRDIWLTSCRRSTLAEPAVPTGTIHLTPLRMLHRDDSHQTLSAVEIAFTDGSRQNAVIGFVFRSWELSDGH